jgi:hypothetical protein
MAMSACIVDKVLLVGIIFSEQNPFQLKRNLPLPFAFKQLILLETIEMWYLLLSLTASAYASLTEDVPIFGRCR